MGDTKTTIEIRRQSDSYEAVRRFVDSQLKAIEEYPPGDDEWMQGRESALRNIKDMMDELDQIR